MYAVGDSSQPGTTTASGIPLDDNAILQYQDLIRGADLSVEQYQALLQVSESIAKHLDLTALVHDLAHLLPRVAHVNFVALSLYDPARHVMQLHNLQANIPADIVGGHEEPVEETPTGLVWQEQQPLLVPNLAEEQRWPNVTARMREDGIRSFCIVPLTTALRRLGAMGFASVQEGAYEDTDVEFLQQVGDFSTERGREDSGSRK